MHYRVEVNYNNIGTAIKTPFGVNPTREVLFVGKYKLNPVE